NRLEVGIAPGEGPVAFVLGDRALERPESALDVVHEGEAARHEVGHAAVAALPARLLQLVDRRLKILAVLLDERRVVAVVSRLGAGASRRGPRPALANGEVEARAVRELLL